MTISAEELIVLLFVLHTGKPLLVRVKRRFLKAITASAIRQAYSIAVTVSDSGPVSSTSGSTNTKDLLQQLLDLNLEVDASNAAGSLASVAKTLAAKNSATFSRPQAVPNQRRTPNSNRTKFHPCPLHPSSPAND